MSSERIISGVLRVRVADDDGEHLLKVKLSSAQLRVLHTALGLAYKRQPNRGFVVVRWHDDTLLRDVLPALYGLYSEFDEITDDEESYFAAKTVEDEQQRRMMEDWEKATEKPSGAS